jgi:hypothetical protein
MERRLHAGLVSLHLLGLPRDVLTLVVGTLGDRDVAVLQRVCTITRGLTADRLRRASEQLPSAGEVESYIRHKLEIREACTIALYDAQEDVVTAMRSYEAKPGGLRHLTTVHCIRTSELGRSEIASNERVELLNAIPLNTISARLSGRLVDPHTVAKVLRRRRGCVRHAEGYGFSIADGYLHRTLLPALSGLFCVGAPADTLTDLTGAMREVPPAGTDELLEYQRAQVRLSLLLFPWFRSSLPLIEFEDADREDSMAWTRKLAAAYPELSTALYGPNWEDEAATDLPTRHEILAYVKAELDGRRGGLRVSLLSVDMREVTVIRSLGCVDRTLSYTRHQLSACRSSTGPQARYDHSMTNRHELDDADMLRRLQSLVDPTTLLRVMQRRVGSACLPRPAVRKVQDYASRVCQVPLRPFLTRDMVHRDVYGRTFDAERHLMASEDISSLHAYGLMLVVYPWLRGEPVWDDVDAEERPRHLVGECRRFWYSLSGSGKGVEVEEDGVG